MKKIFVSFLCFSVMICCIVVPINGANAEDYSIMVQPRFEEIGTASKDSYHGTSGYVRWTCTYAWDSRTNTISLRSVSSKINFPFNPTYRIKSYTSSPKINGIISNNYVRITYYIYVTSTVTTGPHIIDIYI